MIPTTAKGLFTLSRPALTALCIVSVVSIFLLSIRTVPYEAAIGALIVIWASALPLILYLDSIEREPLPFFPSVGFYYIVFFGLPTFAAPWAYRADDKVVLYYRILLEPPSFLMFVWLSISLLTMIAGFYLSRIFLFARLRRFLLPRPNANPDSLRVLYWILLIGGLSYRYFPLLDQIHSIGQFLVPVSYVALGGFYLLWRDRQLPPMHCWLIVLVCVPLEIYARIRILFITDILFLGIFFACVLWRAKQFHTLVTVLVVGGCLAASYSIIQPKRWGATFLERFDSVVAYAGSIFTAESQVMVTGHYDASVLWMDRRFSPLVHRVGQIWVFQHVYEKSPEPIPYWMGETYRPLLTSIIPRIFFPDKPEERAGKAFGLRYGFTEAETDPTSYNIPWVVEVFINFGFWGLTLGMALIGLLLAFLDKVFNAPGMNDAEFLIGAVILFRLIYPESNFSVMVGSLPVLFVVLYVYFGFGPRLLSKLGLPAGR